MPMPMPMLAAPCRECPLAISQFCGSVPAGKAAVIRCLQSSMVKPHFPAGCKAVMAQLTDRAQVKYSLNTRLIEACMMGERHVAAAGGMHALPICLHGVTAGTARFASDGAP